MEATIYYIKHYVVCKTKYRWAFYNQQLDNTKTNSAEITWKLKLDWRYSLTETQRWKHALRD